MSKTSQLDQGIREIVFTNLRHAAENGSFEPGGYLHGYSAEDIAFDLTLCSSDCEDFNAVTLIPYVREWLARA